MMARLLSAVAFLMVSNGLFAQVNGQSWNSNLKIKEIFDSRGNPVKTGNLMQLLDSAHAMQLWQRMVFPNEPVPEVTLKDVHYNPTSHLDTNAIFHRPDIASKNSSSARWYGAQEQYDHDPHILFHGHESAIDTGILFGGARNLMLWFETKEPEPIEPGFWDQFPSLKIDSTSYQLYRSYQSKNELGILFSGVEEDADHTFSDVEEVTPYYSGDVLNFDGESGSGSIGNSKIDENAFRLFGADHSYYYEKDGTRYYMQKAPVTRNLDPGMKSPGRGPKAKRIGKSDIWLINSVPKKK